MRTQKLQEAEKRIQNFDRIIQKIYEDKVCEDPMEEWFVTMRKFYKREQQELKEGVKSKSKSK